MKKILLCLLLFLGISGCATSNKNHHANIVNREVSRLSLPIKPLSSYSNFKLENLVLNDETRLKEDKTKVAKELDVKLHAKLLPLLNEWSSNKNNNESGTLVIKPQLHQLHVVSAGARFWIGGMAGESRIDMDLKIIDAQTGKEIARPRIMITASAMSGGWSVGATDKNLLNYIADISYEYLKNNYN
jgi:uncharacterized protein DUF4410